MTDLNNPYIPRAVDREGSPLPGPNPVFSSEYPEGQQMQPDPLARLRSHVRTLEGRIADAFGFEKDNRMAVRNLKELVEKLQKELEEVRKLAEEAKKKAEASTRQVRAHLDKLDSN